MWFALALALLPQDTSPGGAYRRVVTAALSRAQTRLEAGLDLEVDHSRWDDPWIVRTAHYEVRTTKSRGQAATLAKSLEFMRAEFEQLLGPAPAREERQRIWIVPDLGAYNQLGNDHGGDHSSVLGSFFAQEHPERPVIAMQSQNPTLLGMWVTHSAAHQYVNAAFGEHAPTWVSEGLASYFALYWDWSFGARELARLRGERRLLPLATLMRETLPNYRQGPETRFLQLGMLFHFLLNSCEITRNGTDGDPETGPFREYLRLAVRGEDTRETDFAQSLDEALDVIEEEFQAHEFEPK